MKQFIKDFKEFAVRGNVLDMAIGVIIGGAFGKIVASLVSDIITPIISILLDTSNLATLGVVIGQASDGSDILLMYGAFLMNVIDFILIVLTIFIFLRVIIKMKKKEEKIEEAAPVKSDEVLLLEEIRDSLKKK
ncbi:MAG: large-conductance mechanosensitive channel protein MscL [Erysipelotrichaceae bacterium]